jgi:hypothetical protein
MSVNRIFSTGILRVGAAGNTALGSGNVIGAIQDAAFKDAFSRDESWEATMVSVRAQDAQDSEGKTTLEFSSEDIPLWAMPYFTGAAARSVTVGDVARTEYSPSTTSVPPYARIEFATVSTVGKNMTIVGTRVKLTGSDISMSRKGYAKGKFTCDFYPDPNAVSPNDGAAAANAPYFVSIDN